MRIEMLSTLFKPSAMFGLAVLFGTISGCVEHPIVMPPDDDDVGTNGLPSLALELIQSGITSPTDIQAPADGSGRLFIVEQAGRIRISQGGELQDADDAFLDITDRVLDNDFERGLVGLAFHPDFDSNGRFFVNYITAGENAGDTVIAEYTAIGGADHASPATERIVLTYAQPTSIHNGGQLQFGPDGMLYIAAGDGGGPCDSNDNAQDITVPLGKILRIDVDNSQSIIPEDNPYAGDANARGEIWARGLRNPWRFSFDAPSGLVFIADVGQYAREEVDIVPLDVSTSPNFGWLTYEGTRTPPLLCSISAIPVDEHTEPLIEYTHDDGCSITGGYVYRGAAIPELTGVYFYSDFCEAFIRTARVEGGKVVAAVDMTDMIEVRGGDLTSVTTFGRNEAGELYVAEADGQIYKLVADRE